MKRDRVLGFVALAILILSMALMMGAGTSVNGSRTLQSTLNFCADAGASDTYSCNMAPALQAYVSGACYTFKANTANTGAASINFNGLGAKTIVKVAGGIATTLADNDIRAGQYVNICYDGTNMEMQSLLGNAPSSGVTSVNGQTGAVTGTGAATVLIEQHTASSSSTLNFTTCITSTYDTYEFEFLNLLPSATANLTMRMSTDGGMTYDSGSNYAWANLRWITTTSVAGGSTSDTSLGITTGNSVALTNYTWVGFLKLYAPGGASFKRVVSEVAAFDGTGGGANPEVPSVNGGSYKSTTAVNAVQFFPTSGNFTSGTIRCYAIAKS